jgi:uncharacterized protein HemX
VALHPLFQSSCFDVPRALRECAHYAHGHGRATRKAQKEAEVRQRREDRATRAAAKKVEEALQKAKRQQQRKAKAAQKRLETESKASNSTPRKRRKIQKEPGKHMVATIEPEPQDAPKHLTSRSGRIIKKRAYIDDV